MVIKHVEVPKRRELILRAHPSVIVHIVYLAITIVIDLPPVHFKSEVKLRDVLVLTVIEAIVLLGETNYPLKPKELWKLIPIVEIDRLVLTHYITIVDDRFIELDD